MDFSISTQGHGDVLDITSVIQDKINEQEMANGAVLVFVPGSTAAITTIEYENGVIQDLVGVLNKIAPPGADYKHHVKWGDNNGDAHIKAGIIGPSLIIPFEDKKLLLGTWQQIVLADFDEKTRQRKIIIKIIKTN